MRRQSGSVVVPGLTIEHTCKCTSFILGVGGLDLLRRIETLGLEPHEAHERYIGWLRVNPKGDLVAFVEEREAACLDENGFNCSSSR